MGRSAVDLSPLSPTRRVFLLAGRGLSIADIVQETGLSERDVRGHLSIARHGRDMIAARDERRQFVERALVFGLATGSTVVQIAALLGDTLPMTDKALRTLRARHGAKTNAHLIAILLTGSDSERPDPAGAAPSPVLSWSGSICPDCGGQLQETEGCERCHQCGYSRC